MIPTQRPEQAFAHLGARLLRTRWFVRAPIRLYRAGLGFLFGRRLLMLEHIGRTSGLRRYVVLEVIDHTANRYVVIAGFGERAQWLRNVQAHPEVRVWVGARRHVPATAHRLSREETAEVIDRYARQHPQAWRALLPVIEQTIGARREDTAADLPAVALELQR